MPARRPRRSRPPVWPHATRNRPNPSALSSASVEPVDERVTEPAGDRLRAEIERGVLLLGDLQSQRGVGHTALEVLALRVEALDLLADARDLALGGQHVGEIPGALLQQVDETLLGIPRVGQPRLRRRRPARSHRRRSATPRGQAPIALSDARAASRRLAGIRSVAVSERASPRVPETSTLPTRPPVSATTRSTTGRAASKSVVLTRSRAVRAMEGPDAGADTDCCPTAGRSGPASAQRLRQRQLQVRLLRVGRCATVVRG